MQSGLWSGLPLSINLLSPKPWRENINTSCRPFGCTRRRPGQWESFFWVGSMDDLSLKSGSALPVRDCLLKFFWYWTMSLVTQNAMSSNWRHQSGLLAPIHNISNSASRSESREDSLYTFLKTHYTHFSMERVDNAMKGNPERENIMKIWKDYTF